MVVWRSAVALPLIAMMWAGCVSDDTPVEEAAPAPEVIDETPNIREGAAEESAGKPLADFLHDLSPKMKGVSFITEQYRTTVPGPLGAEPGIELDTWIIRPDIDEPVPIILEITPYYTGGGPPSDFYNAVGREMVERGYAMGVSSNRGTGGSGGCFTQGGPSEAQDSAAVIQDLAGKEWSNGNVGVIGVSYPGTTPQDVWVEAPPALKTIVPISGISDLIRYNFVHNVHVAPQGHAFNLYYWALVGAPPATDETSVAGTIAGEACPDQADVQQGGLTSGVDGNKDAYWQARDFGAEYHADTRTDIERASVFYIHGLQDWNVKTHMMEDWIETLWGSGVPMKMWLGQWGHAWPASTNPDNPCVDEQADLEGGPACRADWWNQTLVAWFDHWLKGIDTGIMDAPAVQVQDDQGRWRHEDRWPPVDADALTFYLQPDMLSLDGPGNGEAMYVLRPAPGETPQLVGVQDPPDVSGLRFLSDPLPEDITISGMPRLVADLTPSGARANLIFSIGEAGSGGVRWINHGAQSLNHMADDSAGAPSVAGQTITVDVNMFPQDDVIKAGSRLALHIGVNTAGGPAPLFVPQNDVGTVTIDLASASLTLPIDTSLVYEERQPYA